MISLKKLLAGVLSAAMILGTMAIPAFAAESTSGNAAKIGETEYATLANAVAAAKKDDTITMLGNVTESIVIENGNTITLDLNGYTLTNTDGKHTIENNGTLTINDSSNDKTGTVDNVIHARGALVNHEGAVATLNGGKFYRSLEAGNSPDNNGGNSWYTILNQGTMTINDGATVENGGCYSANIRTDSELTVNGGTFKGGINTIKVDENGELTINDGNFSNDKATCIFNWNKTTINGGTFTRPNIANTSVCNGFWDPTSAVGELTITGGIFNGVVGNYADYPGGIIAISGGTFTTDVSEYATANRTVMKNSDGTYTVSVAKIGDQGYSTLKDAVDAAKENETVTLLDDVTINPKGEGDVLVPQITIDKSVTLDLAGHKIAYDASVASQNLSYTPAFFMVCNNADVTITGNGTIDCEAGNNGAYGINVYGGNLTIENGTFYGAMTVAQVQEGSLNVKGGYYDLAPSVKSQVPAYAKYIINAIDSAFKDGSAIISVTGGTFVNFDPSANPEGIDTSYVAKGYYSKDNQDGTFSVLQSAAKVIDNAKSAGVKVTLDNLEKNSAIDKTADATYNVVLDTVKPEDKAAVDEIKNANPNKTVIAYDIYVEKTENGIKSEVKDVTNQKVTLKLPTKVKEGGEVKVYHNGIEINDVAISEDRMSVSFTAPSFSAYTFVYDADALTDSDITKNVKVEFEKVTDSEYDIVLKATEANKKINGLLTADLTFSLTQGTTGLVNYEITPAANMSLLVNGNRYTFSFDGTNAHSATGDEIVIGKVVFDGYCTGANFKVDTTSADAVNKLHTTEAVDSIVDEYLTNGDGTNTGKLDAAASIDGINLTQETANLTVNVSFPNAVMNQAATYQDMKVTVSGNGVNEEVKLGEGVDGVTFANDTYTVEFTNKLVKGNTYTVTVSGAGYRTARYTVSMTGAKTLNFWNNVKTVPAYVEENVGNPTNTNFLAGDIVKDGQINIYDLSAVISYFGTDNLVDNHPTYAKYDLNRDGVIDSKDVAYVLVSWGK
jgi:hypothetical protein